MSEYNDVMATNPPNLKVTHERGEDGTEQFGWGINGSMPGAALVSFIGRLQIELWGRDVGTYYDGPWCDERCLAIVYDATRKQFSWFVHPDIPIDPLCGTLELIKVQLVANQIGQQRTGVARPGSQPRRQLFGPDGSPLRG